MSNVGKNVNILVKVKTRESKNSVCKRVAAETGLTFLIRMKPERGILGLGLD